MPLFRTKDNREVVAFRLETPLTIGPGLMNEREYYAGDWIVLDGRVRFMHDHAFRNYYEPADGKGRELWDAKYDLTVDENRPMLSLSQATVGRSYMVVLKALAVVLPHVSIRGVLVQRDTTTATVRTDDDRRLPFAVETIAFLIPEEPESEPCLLRLKESTAAAKAPRPLA